jgi:hypothetical protein
MRTREFLSDLFFISFGMTVGFVVGKLTGFIDWSWWLVISPILIALAANVIGLFVLMLIGEVE